MAAAAKRIEIGAEDRAALEAIVGAGTSQARMVMRARIVLCAGEGRSAAQIGRRVGCSANTAPRSGAGASSATAWTAWRTCPGRASRSCTIRRPGRG